jgi:hypothetical protein
MNTSGTVSDIKNAYFHKNRLKKSKKRLWGAGIVVKSL